MDCLGYLDFTHGRQLLDVEKRCNLEEDTIDYLLAKKVLSLMG